MKEKLFAFSTIPPKNDLHPDDYFGNFGFKDKNGNVIIEPQYLSAKRFSCGLCPVCINMTWYHTNDNRKLYEMHWGFIDEMGKMRIPAMYREANNFNKYGVAVVLKEYDGDWQFIDTSGNEIAHFPYISEWSNINDRFIMYRENTNDDQKNNNGLFDTKERKVVYPKLAYSYDIQANDRILVTMIDEERPYLKFQKYINSKGEDLYPWQVDKGFNEVSVPNKLGYSKVGVVKAIERIDGDLVKIDTKYGVIDNKGKVVIPIKYDIIKNNNENVFYCTKGNDDEAEIVL